MRSTIRALKPLKSTKMEFLLISTKWKTVKWHLLLGFWLYPKSGTQTRGTDYKLSKRGAHYWSQKICKSGAYMISHNTHIIHWLSSPVIMKEVWNKFLKRLAEAFQPVGGAKNTIKVFLKLHWTDFRQILYVCSLGRHDQNLKCHIDGCKWALPIKYLLITRDAFSDPDQT